jgi:hypothetical protein
MRIKHLNHSENEWPIYVHSDLLDRRSLKIGELFETNQLRSSGPRHYDTEVHRFCVDLSSHRALMLWSGWLYGRPMWSPTTCEDVDDDLLCIVDIYQMCAGLPEEDEYKDYDGMNACLDAVRDILLDEVHVPSDPLLVLGPVVKRNPTATRMLTELLIYGKCSTDGRTQRWLQAAEGTDWAQGSKSLPALGVELTKKLMGREAPDLTARCAYHVYPLAKARVAAGVETSIIGKCILHKRSADIH